MCGAKYLKSIESSLMLISSCCHCPLYDTLLSGFPVFTSSSDQKCICSYFLDASEEMCQSHHFDQLLHHFVTSMRTFPASHLAGRPITRVKIRRKQTYWAAKILIVISWGKPSGASGIRLLPIQSTDFPESLEHSSLVYVAFWLLGCFICDTFVDRMLSSDALSAGYVLHAFRCSFSIAATCKKCRSAMSGSTKFDTQLQHRWSNRSSNPTSNRLKVSSGFYEAEIFGQILKKSVLWLLWLLWIFETWMDWDRLGWIGISGCSEGRWRSRLGLKADKNEKKQSRHQKVSVTAIKSAKSVIGILRVSSKCLRSRI